MSSKKVNIFWFRRDLRLKDNRGLLHALQSQKEVLPIFIFDTNILSKLEDENDLRVSFIHDAITDLKEELNDLGSDLLILTGDPLTEYKKLIKEYNIEEVYTNEDYEPYAIKRDKAIASFLEKENISFRQYKDHCIFAKDDILKDDGKPYVVYTPYKNKWLAELRPKDIATLETHKYFDNFKNFKAETLPTLEDLGFIYNEKADEQVKTIKGRIIDDYDKNRDIPALDATSKLGIHLRFGTISPRKCAQVGYKKNDTWLSELIWREFFIQILYHFPHVENAPFREKYKNIKWKNNKKEFKKWCEGKTGFPIVDAGMRELNETGYMHNRVRMIAASFLVKDLLIDWRWGEKYFARKLNDFELASNNGNWQWVAGTGCDAAPYFRIFNPYTQQKKFDPDFEYIKKWIPEYGTDKYPDEIVDHKIAYHETIRVYKECN
ncbi:deoxyribodipyrimidine photo-lyase [Halobacteriovorax vibrionivorans]|uniref:Deoxyribodipyrimidine photo-lyase n=1 Tax=Halobacteriovorax vibrionivorans TaxID=2152716 RepID=A0ABY0IIG5_9BACT|nr:MULTISPECIES: deoxyribodipyrimidine photo-lyase [Halobacteriovorax]RZF22264.1 deoxyribodipyrimidine photo-lyase [Halobacteriovorax vibrionivorans]TGD48516.1 deoxyribodipyrimidine photo-lyase [Halobacteriovorax sp. Y22]